ncbi:hypothetical protein AB0M44_42045 [Streptosporangium subroseum]|uniref:hypothetical protein n=1 Tax=Streptosporangium subroseum TaxID=106412 RepID=UPI0034437085
MALLATGSTRPEAEAESTIRADVLASGVLWEEPPRSEAPSSASRTGVNGSDTAPRAGVEETKTQNEPVKVPEDGASRAIPARCEITSARLDPEDPFRRLGVGGAMPGMALAAGPHFVTVLNDELSAFEDGLSDEIDDLSDVGTNRFHRPAPGVAVVVHRTRSSGANPRAGTARGPPVRTERLFPGVPRPHRLRPNPAGVDRPCTREDHADARTRRPEDP